MTSKEKRWERGIYTYKELKELTGLSIKQIKEFVLVNNLYTISPCGKTRYIIIDVKQIKGGD